MIYSLLIWPGALLFAPLTGIFAITVGPNVKYAKTYACWSRFAGVAILTMIIIYCVHGADSSSDVQYLLSCMCASQLYQLWTVDIYIAHIESARITRGWDGLTSCLYVSNDKKAYNSDVN